MISALKNVDPKREKLESLLQQAREKTEVLHIPKPFRRFFRKQGAFNRLLLETATALIKTDSALNEVVGKLDRALLAQNEWLKVNAEYLRNAQSQLWGAIQHIATLRAEGERAGEHVRNLQAESDRIGLNLKNLQTEFATTSQALTRLELRLQSQATQRELLEERLTNDNVYIKGELSQQARIVRQSLEGGPKLSQPLPQ